MATPKKQSTKAAQPSARGKEPADLSKTVIRQLYKPEVERKGRRNYELCLLNLTRKLNEDQRLAVYTFAESLAIGRINALLQRRRAASREARHG